MTETINALRNQIDSLGEFLYDDYGDTVEQLGMEKTRELELEYQELKDKLSTLLNENQ